METKTLTAAMETFLSRRGQIVTVEWKRLMKTRKGITDTIEKYVQAQARAGVNYDNLQAVQEKRESGDLPAENAGLPWGKWFEFPHIIEHKGMLYFRFATFPSSVPMVVKFFRNGKEVEKESLRELCLASEFSERDGMDVFTVKEESILAIR